MLPDPVLPDLVHPDLVAQGLALVPDLVLPDLAVQGLVPLPVGLVPLRVDLVPLPVGLVPLPVGLVPLPVGLVPLPVGLVAPAVPVAAPRRPRSETAVRASYLICATPRTGSYFLCDQLTATGVAGRPTEYLLPGYRRQRTDEWGTSTYLEYHQHSLAAGTTANGVFGTKVHGAQMLQFLRLATGKSWVAYEDRSSVVEKWFPNPSYVWIRRRDRVAQGVSWVKARQSHIWWESDIDPAPPIGAPEPESLRFDCGAVDRAIDALTEWDGEWRTFFDAAGIEPLTVWYEDLLADPRGSVDRVLETVGIPEVAGPESSDPASVTAGFRRQADEMSAAWGSRFRRLDAVKLESTLSALAGLHSGEVVYVCVGTKASDRIPRDGITISVDGGWSPPPASFALLTRQPESRLSADVVVTTRRFFLDRPLVIRSRFAPEGESKNALAVAPEASPAELGRALAGHLGAGRIEIVGT